MDSLSLAATFERDIPPGKQVEGKKSRFIPMGFQGDSSEQEIAWELEEISLQGQQTGCLLTIYN